MMKERRRIQRPIIERLKTSLKEGYLYEDKDPSENTHPVNKRCNRTKHVLTKDINDFDRLGYEVRPPKNNIIDVKLINRVGHL